MNCKKLYSPADEECESWKTASYVPCVEKIGNFRSYWGKLSVFALGLHLYVIKKLHVVIFFILKIESYV